MTVLWSHGNPMTIGAVAGKLQRTRQVAYTTVLTIMNRLVAKGLLTRSVEAPYQYGPRHTRQEFFRSAAGSFLSYLRRQFGPVAMACFIDEVEKADRKEIRQLLARLRARKRA